MQNDVLFSIFDPQKGPIILYSTISSQEIAKKIVMKSYVAIGAMEEKIDLESKYALLPLPSYDRIAFYYMFKIQNQDLGAEKVYATITFAQNSSATINFYRSLPEIQKMVLDSVNHLQESFTYTKNSLTLNNEVKAILESLSAMKPVKETSTPIPSTETIVFEDPNSGTLNFLLEYFQDGLEKVIYSLLMEEPILVLGNVKEIVDKIVNSMEILVPHRVLSKEYVLSYVDPKNKDLLICSPNVNFLKKYKDLTIVDVQSRKISKKKSRELHSMGNLIHTLKIAPSETQKSVIHNYIDNLLAKTAQLIELCEQEQIGREEIQTFRAELQPDELFVVISMVKRYTPQFETKLFHFARSLF
ncbi:MAG: hypothetical protein ACW98F_01875 [Candidatus Hodarchaeales archaeon]|jgi:hypothetical protein